MKLLNVRLDKKYAIAAFFFCIIFLAVFWFFIHAINQQKMFNNELELQKLKRIEDNILTYKAKYGNLDEYMLKIDERYNLASVSLPEDMQQGEFINFLQETALANQVKIIAMTPDKIQSFVNENENKSDDVKNENDSNSNNKLMKNVIKLPIDIKIECGYMQLVDFLKAIENSERMINIKNLSIISKDDGDKLNVNLNIIIFALKESNNMERD